MADLNRRLEVADTALRTFEGSIDDDMTVEQARDAAILRFAYSFEAVWKAVKAYLEEVEGQQPGSPKGTVRAAHAVGLLNTSEAEAALAMVNDRNLTVHVYNQALAERLAEHLEAHALLLRAWLDRTVKRAGKPAG